MMEDRMQVDLFSRILKIEFKDSGVAAYPCACVITRVDRDVPNTGTGSTNVKALESALNVMAYTLGVNYVSFALKLCDPLPDVPEELLKRRDWQITRDEIDSHVD